MSAVPKRVDELSRPPAQKLTLLARIKGLFSGKTRAEVKDALYRSPWNGTALLPDFGRVSKGACGVQLLWAIHLHSKGGPRHKGERPPEWTPVLRPDDISFLISFSSQMCRSEVDAFVERGILLRKSEEGPGSYQFKIDYEYIRTARRAFSIRDSAFTRKPIQSERVKADQDPEIVKGDRKEKTLDSKATYEPTSSIAIDEVKTPLPAGTVAVAAQLVEPARVEVTHSLPCAVLMSTTFSAAKGLRIHLTSPGSAGQPPDGAGLAVIAAADRMPPNPDQIGFPFAGDAFLDRLAELGTPVNDAMLARLRSERGCAEGFFLQELTDAVKRAVKKGRQITTSVLPSILAEANQKWRNGGQKVWEESAALLAQQDARREAIEREQRIEMAHHILASTDPMWTDEERAQARAELKRGS